MHFKPLGDSKCPSPALVCCAEHLLESRLGWADVTTSVLFTLLQSKLVKKQITLSTLFLWNLFWTTLDFLLVTSSSSQNFQYSSFWPDKPGFCIQGPCYHLVYDSNWVLWQRRIHMHRDNSQAVHGIYWRTQYSISFILRSHTFSGLISVLVSGISCVQSQYECMFALFSGVYMP